MIYRNSNGKLETYRDLYDNLKIGADEYSDWDNRPPPPSVANPPRQHRYFGLAQPSFDPDRHVYDYYANHQEMATKRKHDGRKVEQTKAPSESSADSAPEGNMPANDTRAASQTAPPPQERPISGGSSQAQATSTSNDSSQSTAWPRSSTDGSDTAPANATTVMPLRQVLYHALHQSNIIVATMSSYFSQDAIIRDLINASRPLLELADQHRSTVYLLVSTRGRMNACRTRLLGSGDVAVFEKEGSFRSFCSGMEKLDKMVGVVEDAAKKGGLASTENVAKLKVEWQRCMCLRDGNEGHEPWTLCWELVRGF